MEKIKQCFVIMPISDSEGYPPNHFSRVYEHLIKPACELAGFDPFRADNVMTTNYIALDIIKNIINAEMAICDLSSKNPNVLYELGIRQAFNLPVTLIKDLSTKRIFDIQGFRDIEYDESLRIDTVQEAIELLAETLRNTYENRNTEINSLTGLLSIEPAKLSEKTNISVDTELILNSLKNIDKRISVLEYYGSKNPYPSVQRKTPDFPVPENASEVLTIEEAFGLQKGDKVFHSKFGSGEILSITERAKDSKLAVILFEEVGEKSLLLSFAKLRRLKS